ncbi:MAG: response regulator [Victivallaceae bacterium]|jgi:CheY-like chemotaxis protein|nr:response regulator [Victivallaceae bacterium]NLK83834.1 response regulator [Lentisphaerota bacterium]MDD3116793.1 response regulator [Victivallaceae bacterium]MDD3704109.1 response regulator [Victivallaceae bacterium]MDD4318468.1 response regulator [Victivallaceae bacterium]
MSEEKIILVCDDDEIFRTFLLRVLKSSGLNAIAAVGGDEAMEVLDRDGQSIALMLVDLVMPMRSGWEVIDYAKKRHELAKIPVIAITGLAPDPEALEKVEKQCVALVHKGGNFDVDALLTKIKALLQL